MPGKRFNPPPDWPVSPGWSPTPEWVPPPEWPPAPPGWVFWVDEDTGRSRRGLLIGALVSTVIVAAAVVGVVWSRDRDGDSGGMQARPERMLPGTYPSQPAVAWSRAATDLYEFGIGSLGAPGSGVRAAVVGEHVILVAESEQDARLMSLSMSDGHTEWSTEPFNILACADRAVDGALPCVTPSMGRPYASIELIDVSSGQITSKHRPPSEMNVVAADGHHVYLLSRDGSSLKLSKGSRENPTDAWTTTVGRGACDDSDDGAEIRRLTVAHGLVWGTETLGGAGVNALVHASDGTEVVDYDLSDVDVTNGGDTITAQHCRDANFKHYSSEILTRDGKVVFSTDNRLLPRDMDVHTGSDAPVLTTAGDAVDAATGEKRWHTTLSTDPTTAPLRSWLIGSVLITGGADGLTGHAVLSGNRLWHIDAPIDDSADAVTDGLHFIVSADDGITAYSIADGTQAWHVAPGTDGESSLFATDAGLLTVGHDRVALLLPTGPAAPVPAIDQSHSRERSGKTRLITPCGRTPTFETVAVHTGSEALVMTMKITAMCPGGDVLSAPRTRITVTSNGANIASGIFDFSDAPLVIPPADRNGSSDPRPSVEHEFRFPLGTFWRLPISTDEQPFNGSPQQGPVDLEPSTMVVACQQDGGSQQSAPYDPSTAGNNTRSTASGPAPPASGDPESAAFDALRAIADADRRFVIARLANHWVAQLSSKKPGIVDDGIIWDNSATLREHLQLRMKYPEARLLWSGDWSTFSAPDFWVTIAGVVFPDSDTALRWCTDHGFDRDHCYAKLVSTTHPIDGSTAYNP